MISHRWVPTSIFWQEKDCFLNWICKYISHAQLGCNKIYQMPSHSTMQCFRHLGMLDHIINITDSHMVSCHGLEWHQVCRYAKFPHSGSHKHYKWRMHKTNRKLWTYWIPSCSSGATFSDWTWPLIVDVLSFAMTIKNIAYLIYHMLYSIFAKFQYWLLSVTLYGYP